MSINNFFQNGKCDIAGLAKYLDGLDQAKRIAECVSLNGKQQEQLWNAAEGGKPLTLDHFVPANKGPLQQVIHHGKNSLPLFTKFQKRFCKAAPESKTANLWGYNEGSTKTIVGPGYFVTRPTTAGELDNHGVVVDYTIEPQGKAEGWPKFIPNNKRLSRFVYNGTKDYMRGVSKHLSIGRASRGKEWMPNWFILCRED